MKRPTPYGWLLLALAAAPVVLVAAIIIPAFAAGYMAAEAVGAGQLFEEEKK